MRVSGGYLSLNPKNGVCFKQKIKQIPSIFKLINLFFFFFK